MMHVETCASGFLSKTQGGAENTLPRKLTRTQHNDQLWTVQATSEITFI